MRAPCSCHAQKPTVIPDLRWCKLTQSGVLRFDGADVKAFLQGQLTNDITALTPTRSQYAGYCTPKGRLLASFLLWQHEGACHMLLPLALCEPVRKRLSMYILRAKVKAADVSGEYVLFGLTGAGAAALSTSLAGAAPEAAHHAVHQQGLTVIRLPVERYLVAVTPADTARVEAALAAAATESPATLWDALDIEAGIPSVVAATQEQFVPQTVNYDLIGAVSFDKGCYPGQEIVARAHYLGKVKQRMVRARIAANETPMPGDKLYTAAFGDQASGMIVAATTAEPGNHDVLAVVQTSSLTDATVHWQSPAGPALQIAPLPYEVK
jgi:tRNA-modifying protein YgfZ